MSTEAPFEMPRVLADKEGNPAWQDPICGVADPAHDGTVCELRAHHESKRHQNFTWDSGAPVPRHDWPAE